MLRWWQAGPCIWKMSVLLIFLFICASPFWRLLQSIIYSVFVILIAVFPHDSLMYFVSEWSPYTFTNKLASNHTIEFVNTSIGTFHSILDKWTIENKHWGLNRCQTRLNAGSKITYFRWLLTFSPNCQRSSTIKFGAFACFLPILTLDTILYSVSSLITGPILASSVSKNASIKYSTYRIRLYFSTQ